MKTRVINLKAVKRNSRRGGWFNEPSLISREERRLRTHISGYGPDDEPGWLEDTTLGY